MKEEESIWTLSTDGSMNAQSASIRIVLESTNGLVLKEGVRLSFKVTNNGVEYKALIYVLELARHLIIKKLKVRGDSFVVIGQMNRVCEVKEPQLKKYFDKASAIVKYIEQIEIQQVPPRVKSTGGCIEEMSFNGGLV